MPKQTSTAASATEQLEVLKRLPPCTFDDFQEQQSVYQGLFRTLRENTFVHAYLISGPQGVGKRSLAGLLTRYLLCTGDQKPCGVCPSCQQVLTANHPDVITLKPGEPIGDTERGRKTIPVDDIRVLSSVLSRSTYEGGRRVVVIEQADKLYYPNASNALLKTLEEPPEGTVFLLLTDSPGKLLTTIVSRCRSVKLHPWSDEKVRSVLKLAAVPMERVEDAVHASEGSIGAALRLAVDEEYWQRRNEILRLFLDLPDRSSILRVSNSLKDRKGEANEMLAFLQTALRSMLLVQLGDADLSSIFALPDAWKAVAQKADLKAFTGLLDAISEARMMIQSNVTWQAVAEKLLLRLTEEKNRWVT